LGVVTFPTACFAIHDITHGVDPALPGNPSHTFTQPACTASRNPHDIVAAIAGLLPTIDADVLIIGRGGGSLEDCCA